MKKLHLLSSIAALSLAGAMSAVNTFAPAIGGTRTPLFNLGPVYDGLGRKVKQKVHPHHGTGKRFSLAFLDFKAKVESTHSDRPDPRDDKYLHSCARFYRGLRNAVGGRT